MSRAELLPNLAAEEGDDWRAYRREPMARAAARLWSLLFSPGARFRLPAASPNAPWLSLDCAAMWPAALGRRPDRAAYDWLEASAAPIAWLNTETLERTAEEALGARPSGPPAEVVRRLHDKAFAVRTARELGLVPPTLAECIDVLDPDELRAPDRLVQRLDQKLRDWPAWTHRRYTLKPRFGSSGRGRVAGRDNVDCPSVRGALSRLALRGGAIFEPWLERQTDLSVVMHVPAADSAGALPTLLGSLEMIVSTSGVYRGHCGEIDSRGRVFSGHSADEALRADAAEVAHRARELGFSGPCGVDAFSYLEQDGEPGRGSPRECIRSLVEFNARSTMGLVALGLVRRSLSQVRDALDLRPGARRAFLLAFVPAEAPRDRERLVEAGGEATLGIDLDAPERDAESSDEPHPILVFGPDRAALRRAHRTILGC